MDEREERDARRDERDTRRYEEQARLLEERIRSLENEQMRMSSAIDHEQSLMRETLVQYQKVIEKNSIILMGDGETREGLVAWRLHMERRYKMMVKVFSALGVVLLELLRQRLMTFFR